MPSGHDWAVYDEHFRDGRMVTTYTCKKCRMFRDTYDGNPPTDVEDAFGRDCDVRVVLSIMDI